MVSDWHKLTQKKMIQEYKNKKYIRKINYVTEKEFSYNLNDAEKIITRKLKNWEHEDEYRFLIKSDINSQKIGKITKIFLVIHMVI